MRDVVIATARQTAASWRQDATQRRQRSTIDPVADTLESCASELESELARIDDATRLLSVEQYAREHGHAAPTVRRWCLRGELAAEKNLAGDWEIQRTARRVKRPTPQLQETG